MTALMLQGTGTNVGKSLLVAGLARAARRRGMSVAPFKPQNMSNNAAVTADGGEIGRAQALQAMACGIEPITDMNPVLLKPETDVGTHVVLRGRHLRTVKAREYAALKPLLLTQVLESFDRLCAAHDLVIVEGAGSPAEVNLRAGDIANMGFAVAAEVPVVLVGDIDRGGVIAQMIGTQAVLEDADKAMIRGFMINKFRGDPSLFDDGYQLITQQTGWPGFGVLPWFADAWRLPAEDAMDLVQPRRSGRIRIVCLALSRIANFDDLDPLSQEDTVDLQILRPGEALPGDADLVILPGTKSTRGDLAFLRAQGWDTDIAAHHRRGGRILGICGGYQMLGRSISDPEGIEGSAGQTEGLRLLDVETVMEPEKRLTRVWGRHHTSDTPIEGYEIHIGRTTGPDCTRPFARIGDTLDGACSADGLVRGSYLHGMFRSDAFRQKFLSDLGSPPSALDYASRVEDTLDRLADHMEAHLDVDAILACADRPKS